MDEIHLIMQLYERLKRIGWAPVQRMEHLRDPVQHWARGRFIVSEIGFSISADKIKEKTSRGSLQREAWKVLAM